MPTYAEQAKRGKAAQVQAGVDPRLAAFSSMPLGVPQPPQPNLLGALLAPLFNPQEYSPEQGKYEPALTYVPRSAASHIFKAADSAVREGMSFDPYSNFVQPTLSAMFSTPASQAAERAGGLGAAMDAFNAQSPAPSAAGQPQRLGPQIESMASNFVPGVIVSGRARTPARNAQVGGVSNSKHLTDDARDFVPPKGMAMNALYSELRGKFGHEWDVINEGDHVHVEPGKGGGGGAAPSFVNPFDPAYVNQAVGEINKAEQASLQPQTFTLDRAPAPIMPELVTPAPTDFSKVDAAIDAMKPVALAEADRKALIRKNVFAGIAQGLSSLQDGASVGKVLAMVGAGALGGRSAGADEVNQRMHLFDEKMAQWQLLVANNEKTKAQTVAQEAQYMASQMNQRGLLEWQANYGQWQKDNNAQVVGNMLISSKIGADGKQQITSTPIASAVHASAAMARANIYAGASGQFNQGNAMVAQATNGLIMAQTAAAMQSGGNADEQAAAAMTGPAFLARSIVDGGQLPLVLDNPDDMAAFAKDAQRQAVQMGLTPTTKEYGEGVANIMTGMLTSYILANGQNKAVMDKISQAGGVGNQIFAADQFRNTRTRTTTSPKGMTTVETR